jgi:hypothetical protein
MVLSVTATTVGMAAPRGTWRTPIAAVVGFKSSAWVVVAALAGHGVVGAFHGHVMENSEVPVWWPAFCLAFDLGAAGSLAWLIQRRPRGLLE